ncbi:MAG: transposase [Methylococcales bacterium]|nr:transposase [Methylococcales bacterium]MDP3837561.1 transposase [Methylococcales bacterium]
MDFLRDALRQTLQEKPFQIDAWVVLPEYIHAVWTLPVGDDDYSGRWRLIKSRFSHQVAKADNLTHNAKGEYQIWQRRFWEHTIRDDNDFSKHVDYIHYNPVKHGYVAQVRDWQYSTFHRYVKQGLYTADWGGYYEIGQWYGGE